MTFLELRWLHPFAYQALFFKEANLIIFLLLCLSFPGILGTIVMESSKVNVVIQGECTTGGIGLKEVAKGFAFPAFTLTNP